MSICGDCLRRCLTKKSPGSTWCGFFDCDYPPDAKVKGSRWYFWQLRSAPASAPQEEEQEQEEEEEEEEESSAPSQVVMDEQEMSELVGSPKETEAEAPLPPSAKDLLTAQIADLQTLVKTARNTMPVKEQAKILKKIMDLRIKLVELKKNN